MKLPCIVCFGMLVVTAFLIISCDEIVVDGFDTTDIDDQLFLANNLGPAIIISRLTVDEKVVNGASYDLALLTDLDKVKTVQIPDNIIDVTLLNQDYIGIQLKKEIIFAGHPPYPVTPVEARKNMGVAVKRKGDTLAIATIGEWGSKEGGAFIQMKIRIPETLSVVKSPSLYGELSEAMPLMNATTVSSDSTFWYSSSVPGDEWNKVVDIPDTLGVGW